MATAATGGVNRLNYPWASRGSRLPKWTGPDYSYSAPMNARSTGRLFFRDPNNVIPFLQRGRDFVVYYITAHGSQLSTQFVPPTLGKDIPYSVIQTGARNSVGCPFISTGNQLMKNLFSTNLAYSFQYLLGLENDNLPPLFTDLHYATNDVIGSVKELIPDKNLSFSSKEIGIYGVFVYDPNSIALFSKNFKNLPQFDKYFTRGEIDPATVSMFSSFTSPRGIKLSDLLNRIPIESGYDDRPSIFVVYSCADIDLTKNVLPIIRTLAGESFYSLNPYAHTHIDHIDPDGRLPAYALLSFSGLTVPSNWRKHAPSINAYFNRLETAATANTAASSSAAANLPVSSDSKRKPSRGVTRYSKYSKPWRKPKTSTLTLPSGEVVEIVVQKRRKTARRRK
jgi:hypothetical protein